MIKRLKYAAIGLTTGYTGDDIGGPVIADAKDVEVKARGCKLTLALPSHRTTSPEALSICKTDDALNASFDTFNQGVVANDNWVFSHLILRNWSYVASWFRGRKGEIYFSTSVLKRASGKKFKNASFFHPRTLEFAISNYLDTRYGFKKSENSATYKAPINWKISDKLPVNSVSFEVRGSNESLIYIFPISHEHLIKIEFGYMGLHPKMRRDMNLLSKGIIDNVRLQLSTESQAEWDAVNSEVTDMSLAESFAPLRWPINPDDIEKAVIPLENRSLKH